MKTFIIIGGFLWLVGIFCLSNFLLEIVRLEAGFEIS